MAFTSSIFEGKNSPSPCCLLKNASNVRIWVFWEKELNYYLQKPIEGIMKTILNITRVSEGKKLYVIYTKHVKLIKFTWYYIITFVMYLYRSLEYLANIH